MKENPSLLELVKRGAGYLQASGISDNPGLEAELLLSSLLNCDRLNLYLKFADSADPFLVSNFFSILDRRRRHEPLQYIVRKQLFLNRPYAVGPGVLIPRPETELLVLEGLRYLNNGPFLDLGTGTGCIAVSLLLEQKNIREAYAVDISPEAIQYASENARSLGVDSYLHLLEGDLFAPLPGHLKHSFEMIVSNPPYLDMSHDEIDMSVRKFEPLIALDGGEGGLNYYRRIFQEAVDWLKPGGYLILEIGYQQLNPILSLLANLPYFNVLNMIRDEQGIDRVLTLVFDGMRKSG